MADLRGVSLLLIFFGFCAPTLALLFFVILLLSSNYWLTLLYLVWQFYDWQTPHRGGRRSKIRNWFLWKWIASYFPAQLHKTAELPADRNYIFGYHPHGAICFGAAFNILTDATGFSEKYSGLSIRMASLQVNYWIPFHREVVLNMGLVPASKDSISYLMDRRNGLGRACVLVIGGAREMRYLQAGKYVFVLRSRRGFARIALEQGASLVPVISFGNVDAYESGYYPEGSFVRRLQDRIERFLNMPFPLPLGEGFLPKRVPINTVIGEPIHVDRVVEPSTEQVDQLHAAYVEALTKLFNTYKIKFRLKESDELTLV